MEILSYIKKIWLQANSKGMWQPQNGPPKFVEELTDDHLMRIPHFIWKNHKHYTRLYIPCAIQEEIEERGMYIDYDNQCSVKYIEKPAKMTKSSTFNTTKNKSRNKTFFK